MILKTKHRRFQKQKFPSTITSEYNICICYLFLRRAQTNIEIRENGDEINYCWESVACVRNQHAGFSDGSISDGHTLYEPRRAHLRRRIGKPPKKNPLCFFLKSQTFLILAHSRKTLESFMNLRNPQKKLQRNWKFSKNGKA